MLFRKQERRYKLTKAQVRVAALTFRGYNNLTIANMLGISYQVVKNIRRGIFDKLGASTQTELVAMAVDQGALNLWLCDDITYQPTDKEQEFERIRIRRQKVRKNYDLED